MEVPGKTKHRITLGRAPDKTLIKKDPCASMFIAAVSALAKAWEQSKRLSAEWIKKTWYTDPME